MRRATLALALTLSFAPYLLPQEAARPAESNGQAEQGDPWMWWKVANFAILAIGLGYLIRKHAPVFFQQRSQQIAQAMVDATKARTDAQAQAATIEKRMAGLQNEIESLRGAARAEMAADGERITRETEQRLQKIQSQSAQEIALMTRAGRIELRKYAARLALDLAEQRIRSRVTTSAQDGLVDGFVHDLRYQVTQGGKRA
jgi:F-type H+-transporting ATPase subunit b